MLTVRRISGRALVVALAVSVLATQAAAVVLPAGGSVALSGTTAAARPELAGTVIADAIRPFSVPSPLGGDLKGFVQDRIVKSSSTGTLDFYFRIVLDASCPEEVFFVERFGFAPSTSLTDVDWRKDGLGTRAPWQADRSGDGSTVSFHHEYVYGGESSRFTFVKTRAFSYKADGAIRIHFSPTETPVVVPAFRPVY